jgi:hypothetical protein
MIMSKTNAAFKIVQRLPLLGTDLVSLEFAGSRAKVGALIPPGEEDRYRSLTAEVLAETCQAEQRQMRRDPRD